MKKILVTLMASITLMGIIPISASAKTTYYQTNSQGIGECWFSCKKTSKTHKNKYYFVMGHEKFGTGYYLHRISKRDFKENAKNWHGKKGTGVAGGTPFHVTKKVAKKIVVGYFSK